MTKLNWQKYADRVDALGITRAELCRQTSIHRVKIARYLTGQNGTRDLPEADMLKLETFIAQAESAKLQEVVE